MDLIPLVIVIPGRFPLVISFSRFLLEDSTIMMYSDSKRGKPCLRFIVALKKEAGHPLTDGEI